MAACPHCPASLHPLRVLSKIWALISVYFHPPSADSGCSSESILDVGSVAFISLLSFVFFFFPSSPDLCHVLIYKQESKLLSVDENSEAFFFFWKLRFDSIDLSSKNFLEVMIQHKPHIFNFGQAFVSYECCNGSASTLLTQAYWL